MDYVIKRAPQTKLQSHQAWTTTTLPCSYPPSRRQRRPGADHLQPNRKMQPVMVSPRPAPPPHLHMYTPQQIQQLEALTNAHRAAQSQRLHLLSLRVEQSSHHQVRTTSAVCEAGVAVGPLLPTPSVPLNEQRVIALIASLSSQHHLSEYSKIKFGEKGAHPLRATRHGISIWTDIFTPQRLSNTVHSTLPYRPCTRART